MNMALNILNGMLIDNGLQTLLGERDREVVLNVILDELGAEKNGAIVCEISRIPAKDREGNQYYSFYTMIADKLEKDIQESTMVNLNNINTKLLLGAYGIVPETGTLFHKYVYKAKLQSNERLAELLYGLFTDITMIAKKDYDQLFECIAA